MHSIFREHLDTFVIIFLDDILVYSRTLEEHKMHVRKTFEILRKHKLYAKMSKCSFFQQEVEYLGHVVGIDGVKPDPAKIKAIKEWKQPENFEGASKFPWSGGLLQKIHPRLREDCNAFDEFDSQEDSYKWTSSQDEAFNELKTKLTEAPVLKPADPSRDYTVTCDGSDVAVGAVLSQIYDSGEHPVAFESRKMNSAEANYPTHERELLAVIHALRTWRHYLEGKKFKVVTDHYSLKYLMTQPNLSKRQARWLDFLAEFDYEVIHRPGKSNVVADALSRLYLIECLSISEVELDSKLLRKLEEEYARDDESKAIFEYPDRHPNFKVLNQRIYWVDDGRLRLYVPSGTLRSAVMSELHDARCSGHLGIKRTSDLVKRDFYWPSLESDVTDFVRSCDECQRNKPSNQRSAGLLQPLEIPQTVGRK